MGHNNMLTWLRSQSGTCVRFHPESSTHLAGLRNWWPWHRGWAVFFSDSGGGGGGLQTETTRNFGEILKFQKLFEKRKSWMETTSKWLTAPNFNAYPYKRYLPFQIHPNWLRTAFSNQIHPGSWYEVSQTTRDFSDDFAVKKTGLAVHHWSQKLPFCLKNEALSWMTQCNNGLWCLAINENHRCHLQHSFLPRLIHIYRTKQYKTSEKVSSCCQIPSIWWTFT